MAAANSAGDVPLLERARGHRPYMHWIDMANAAPIPADAETFRFRFHAEVESPACWVARAGGKRNPAAKVELFVDGPHGGLHHDLVCLDKAAALKPVENFAFNFDPAAFTYRDEVLSGALVSGHSFLEQLTETVRYGGELLFDGGQWRTRGVVGNPACFQPIPADATLELRMLDTRKRLNVIEYATNYGAKGRMLTTPG